ncbi:MAG: hypothetical protein ACI9K1_001892, partial [Arcticibacterium sp.]
MRNSKSLTMILGNCIHPSRLSSFFAFMTIFIVWASYGVQAQNLKPVNGKSVVKEMSSTTEADWSQRQSLVSDLGDKNGSELKKVFDLEFYGSNDNLNVDFSMMKDSPLREMKLLSSCQATFTNNSNQVGRLWQYVGGIRFSSDSISIQPGATYSGSVSDNEVWEIWNEADDKRLVGYTIDCSVSTDFNWQINSDCCQNRGGSIDVPTKLTFTYTGGGCSFNSINSSEGMHACINGITVNGLQIITVLDQGQLIGGSRIINTGDVVEIYVKEGGGNAFGNELQVMTGIQIVEINTSCSDALVLGQNYGALRLDAVTGENGIVCSTVTISSTVTCNAEGEIVVSASGGSGVYQYKLNSGVWVSSNTFSDLSTGNYTLAVRDVNNIEWSASETITLSGIPTINVNNVSTCIGEEVDLVATGCAGVVTWNDVANTTGDLLNLIVINSDITYTAVCTLNGCLAEDDGFIQVTAQPSLSVNSVTACLGTTATLTTTGCNELVTWNTGAIGNVLLINNALATQEYIATCTQNGCTASVKGIILLEDCTDKCVPPSDDVFEICEDEILLKNVSINDSLPIDAFDVKYMLKSASINGTVLVDANGEFSYTPTNGFSGTDSFEYKTEFKINDSIQGYILDNSVLNSCGTNKVINTYVKGLEGSGQTNTISISNINNLNSATVEVWIENGGCADTI